MEEKGIKDAEELAAAMNAEFNRPFTADEVRAVLADPGRMNAVFQVVVADVLTPDEEQRCERFLAPRTRLAKTSDPESRLGPGEPRSPIPQVDGCAGWDPSCRGAPALCFVR